jgi:succinate-acetate transporter protein
MSIGTFSMLAGIEGIFCGLSAIYASVAQIINNEFGKTILPLG